jgi:hypothetical protein
MRVSEKYKFVFVSLPKGASQTIYRVLGKWYPPIKGYGMHSAKVPPQFEKYFTWTIVRNPYSRAFSQWWHSVGSGSTRPNGKRHLPELPDGMPFKEYIPWLVSPKQNPQPSGPGRRHVQSQTCRLTLFRQDRVLRFEELESGFYSLPFVEEGKPPWFPRVNTKWWHSKLGGRMPPKQSELWTPELADMVYNWERKIFDEYEYLRGSWETL